MILDGMDGRVARLTNTQSEFGGRIRQHGRPDLLRRAPRPWCCTSGPWRDLGKLGWVAAFVHTAGAALRLARFNTQIGTADKRYFQGLPSPSAAAILAGFIWFSVEHGIAGADVAMSLSAWRWPPGC